VERQALVENGDISNFLLAATLSIAGFGLWTGYTSGKWIDPLPAILLGSIGFMYFMCMAIATPVLIEADRDGKNIRMHFKCLLWRWERELTCDDWNTYFSSVASGNGRGDDIYIVSLKQSAGHATPLTLGRYVIDHKVGTRENYFEPLKATTLKTALAKMGLKDGGFQS
jgi:hypothetical protein